MSDVEIVRRICEDRKIPVSVLEKACGFSNGYLNPKKAPKRIPYDRAVSICQFLKIPLSALGYPTSDSVFSPSEDEMHFIVLFRELNAENQKNIIDNIDFLLSKQREDKKGNVTA